MATEIRIEPTLYILLGTSSAQAGWRLKELLHAAYGDLPSIRFLWIDTDGAADPVLAEKFTSAERVILSGFNGDQVLANLSMYPTIRAWWPVGSRLKPGYIRRGANQVRLYGRLALFRMFNDRTGGPAFIDKLRDHLNALTRIESMNATERMENNTLRFVVERGSVRIVIVTSTCGGSGSAISWDVAYQCRHLLAGSNPTLVGVFFLPPVIDQAIKNETHTQWEKIRANAYAWFKEHNYLLDNPLWRVTYPEGAPITVHAPPFDLNFLVDLGNQAGDRLSSEDDVFSMTAQALFLQNGSSIASALNSFNTNVSVLMEEHAGRLRAYSSLAAASLIYPAAKIQRYCGARLAQDMIHQGLLGPTQSAQVSEAASALLGRLGLRDGALLATLLAERQISNLRAPAIRKAITPESACSLLDAQAAQDVQERSQQIKAITASAEKLLEETQRLLKQEISLLVRDHGVTFTRAVLELLLDEAGGQSEFTLSLPAFKRRLAQQGIGEAGVDQAQSELAAARSRLRSLEGDLLQAAWKTFLHRSWEREFEKARNDGLHWLTELNKRSLELAAKRQADNLYDQIMQALRSRLVELVALAQSALRAAELLDETAQVCLQPAGLESGVYELSLEAVDGKYIQAFYKRHATSLNPATMFRAFSAQQPADIWEGSRLEEAWLADRLQTFASAAFERVVQETSLLQALADYHGPQAPQVIENLFDRLVRYCHPFWQYQSDSGLQGQEGRSLIGVDDEHSQLIPARYRTNIQYEVKSTGFKHRIDVARIQHGLPAFLLRGMADYKAYYDARRTGLDPLHVLPEAAGAAEVIPEERQEGRRAFAVACAFGYIIPISSWYYFDARKEYAARRIHPGRENRLGQGRQNAEEAFAQRDDLVRLADNLVETEVVAMGNRAAIALLQVQIDSLKTAIANMGSDGTSENGLRRQYEKEIQALVDKQRQLGYVGLPIEIVER